MAEEELVFQLLDEDRKIRTERIVEERKITIDDCLVLGILRLNKDISKLREEVAGTNKRIDETKESLDGRIEGTKESLNERIDELNTSLNKRIESNFRWTIGLILGMWASTLAILIPILLKISM